ncbi:MULTISPECIES: ECF transporter S component [Bacillus]|uniref:ECF transporter S component n=1 Tax=Bacillus TaxID=1386 RepID=UPI0003F96564|nr:MULTISPECIES: ECF transporter S component [Bacillus]QHZ47462.1 ECF transporter S component [Bacillus sp. NSP9.1]WFA03519.1 ECF transporter S component [Bacillus sp. HSf4]
MKHTRVRRLVSISMLSSIAFILMMLSFPILGAFPYLKIDFSDIPALIAVILYGPGAGIAVEAVKNVLNYFIAGSASGVPIDQTANFVAGVLFIMPAALLLKKTNSAKGFVTALFAGTILMALSMSILNYVLFLPAYTWFLNAPALSAGALKTTILAGILPFNIIKGLAVALVSTAIFLQLKPWLKENVRMAKQL